jgi:sugar lactone lactonase YvrE
MVWDAQGNLFLSDLANNRVLQFDTPLTTDFAADRTFGVAGYGASCPAPASATRLCHPTGLALDGAGNLWVADDGYSRVVAFLQPLTTDAVADFVLGQNGSFTTGLCNNAPGIAATSLCFPDGVAIAPSGNVWVADTGTNRVLEYISPLTTDAVADRVIGQFGSFTTGTCNGVGLSAWSLCGPSDVWLDGAGNVFVADRGNHRVLFYTDPTFTDVIADGVFGQSGSFTTNACHGGGVNASTLCFPAGARLDGNGNLWVTDGNGNRVLMYGSIFTSDAIADIVIGQPNFTTASCYGGGVSSTSMCQPSKVSIDPHGSLVVSESSPFSANRLLFYRSPLTTDVAADRVAGQPDPFGHSACNAGGVSAKSLCNGWSVAVDAAGNVYVADTNNSRVLGFVSPLTTDGVADIVLGQGGSFTSATCNNGGVTANSMCFPRSVAVDPAGNVYVSDELNNRVLVYITPMSSDATADVVFGQGGSFTSATCNLGGVSASSLCGPKGVTFTDAGDVFISDLHRVLRYVTPLTTDRVADGAFGQPDLATNTCNTGGISASSLCAPDGLAWTGADELYVADTQNNRVLRYAAATTSDSVADGVLGAPGFTTGTCNAGGHMLCIPGEVEIGPEGEVYVSDRVNHRVLRGTSSGLTSQVFGQQGSFATIACNNGGQSARSLCFPHGLAVDSQGRLFIADLNNSRVLEFDVVADGDGDGMAAASDNCPGVANASQLNSDAFTDLTPPKVNDDLTWPNSDAPGDACDIDADNDGMTLQAEAAGCNGSGPLGDAIRDFDGDRRLDGAECANGSNPASAASVPASGCTIASSPDTDSDGLRDALESCFYNTHPFVVNTDNDACGDAREVMSMDANLTVNAADLGLTASAFGTYGTPPAPGNEWRVNMDPDKNGVVNAADLGLVASKFGACP